MGDGGEERHGETPRPLFARRGGEGVRRETREREKKAAEGGIGRSGKGRKDGEGAYRPKGMRSGGKRETEETEGGREERPSCL